MTILLIGEYITEQPIQITSSNKNLCLYAIICFKADIVELWNSSQDDLAKKISYKKWKKKSKDKWPLNRYNNYYFSVDISNNNFVCFSLGNHIAIVLLFLTSIRKKKAIKIIKSSKFICTRLSLKLLFFWLFISGQNNINQFDFQPILRNGIIAEEIVIDTNIF